MHLIIYHHIDDLEKILPSGQITGLIYHHIDDLEN